MKTYTVTIKSSSLLRLSSRSFTEEEAKKMFLDDDFCDDSGYDFIDWKSQKIDDVMEDK